MDPFVRQAIVRIIFGCRNGAVYGARIRFAHGIVMAVLFSNKPWAERIKGIITASFRHGYCLAKFVLFYKSCLLALSLLRKHKHTGALGSAADAKGWETFIAGAVAGVFVFGTDPRPVAEQITLYVLARVLVGLSRYLTMGTTLGTAKNRQHAWSVTSSVAWGLVMYLFHQNRDVLQTSMARSMNYLYVESDNVQFTSLDNFFGLL